MSDATFNPGCLIFPQEKTTFVQCVLGLPSSVHREPLDAVLWQSLLQFSKGEAKLGKCLMILTVSLVAAASEDGSLSFLLLPFSEQPCPALEPISLALASHFQLFLQASKLISVIQSGNLWQQLGAENESQGFEACQLSLQWSEHCSTHTGSEDGCLWLHSSPQARTGPVLLSAGGMGSTACLHTHSQGVHQSWSEEAMISSVHGSVWPQGKVLSLLDAKVQTEG